MPRPPHARAAGTAPTRSPGTASPELYAHQRVLELFNARVRQEAVAGAAPGSRGSVGKLAGAMLLRRAVDTAGHLAGANTVAWEDGGTGPRGHRLHLGTRRAPVLRERAKSDELLLGTPGSQRTHLAHLLSV